jgi:hypothetical protein
MHQRIVMIKPQIERLRLAQGDIEPMMPDLHSLTQWLNQLDLTDKHLDDQLQQMKSLVRMTIICIATLSFLQQDFIKTHCK